MSANKEAWGSRVGLILAMAGNAVGLGNFLRFPVQAVQNGGGAFILPYIISFIIMGIPLLWTEWTIGRYGGRFGNHTTPFILNAMGRNSFWKYFGVFGIFTNIAIAAYYCYIESWTMAYVIHSIMQTFTGMSQEEVAAYFGTYVELSKSTTGIPYEAVWFYLICLVLNTYILSRGLAGGVEKVAKIGMPLLILFGIMLAVRAFTLGDQGAYEGCTDCNSFLGLNFLWEPQYTSLKDPKVWLAAATQIFFTLSLGMGSIHCYASYVKKKDDIALNSLASGWMNEFVEVVLGASIVIPIAVGYLGLDWVLQNAGFGMAFQTMPFLFSKWGAVFGTLAGVAWFGLLFFAGITSSLAMGTPWVSFMEDEFDFSRKKAAWSFGLITLIVGLPTVFFFQEGVLDEYDYWASSISLMLFALAESILLGWVFGINKAWDELHQGADVQLFSGFKFIMKYITPVMLLAILLGALFTPLNNDWQKAFKEGWELDASSIVGKITNKGITVNRSYFADYFESENTGKVEDINLEAKTVTIAGKTYSFGKDDRLLVSLGAEVQKGDKIAEGSFVNNIFYIDASRLLLVLLFLFISYLVYKASKRREMRI
ncbi:MAG TPA: sodium-dependent transporter [Cytophagaceae bacterium]